MMILKNDILDNTLDEIIETHKESLEKLADNSNSKETKNYLDLVKDAILKTPTAKECLTKLFIEEDVTEGFYPFLIDVALFADGRSAAEKISDEAGAIIISSEGIDKDNLPFVFEINYIGDDDLEGVSYTQHKSSIVWEDK